MSATPIGLEQPFGEWTGSEIDCVTTRECERYGVATRDGCRAGVDQFGIGRLVTRSALGQPREVQSVSRMFGVARAARRRVSAGVLKEQLASILSNLSSRDAIDTSCE